MTYFDSESKSGSILSSLPFLTALLFFACQEKRDYERIPAFSEEGNAYAVVEIPAGTNRKIEYNHSNGTFESDSLGGKERIIHYLPYPGNYGFIPSTKMSEESGGDGDPLDVLVLSESQPTGTVLKIIPVAVLLLKDAGELDYKIIAIPAEVRLQTIHCSSYQDLLEKYPYVKEILEGWFLNYNPSDKTEVLGWKDEKSAMDEIKKWKTIKNQDRAFLLRK